MLKSLFPQLLGDPYAAYVMQDFAGQFFLVPYQCKVAETGPKASFEAFRLLLKYPSKAIRQKCQEKGTDMTSVFGEWDVARKDDIIVITIDIFCDTSKATLQLSQCNIDMLLRFIIPGLAPHIKSVIRSHDGPNYYSATGPLVAMAAWNKYARSFDGIKQIIDCNTTGGHGKNSVDGCIGAVSNIKTRALKEGNTFHLLTEWVNYLMINGNCNGTRFSFTNNVGFMDKAKRKRNMGSASNDEGKLYIIQIKLHKH